MDEQIDSIAEPVLTFADRLQIALQKEDCKHLTIDIRSNTVSFSDHYEELSIHCDAYRSNGKDARKGMVYFRTDNHYTVPLEKFLNHILLPSSLRKFFIFNLGSMKAEWL